MDGPGEDRGLDGGVGAQRELDAFVAFGLGDHVDERQLQDASPHRGVVGVDAGPVVRGEPQLEDGPELERFAVEEPSGDGVAAGEELEESFGERLAVVDLDADHEAGTGEAGDVVADAGVAVAFQERLEVGGGGVLAEHAADRLQLRALARSRSGRARRTAPPRTCGRSAM